MAPANDNSVKAGQTEAVALAGIDFTEFNEAGLPTPAGLRFRLLTKVKDEHGRSQLSEMTVPADNVSEALAAFGGYSVIVNAWAGKLGAA